jgi:hypothetical protein
MCGKQLNQQRKPKMKKVVKKNTKKQNPQLKGKVAKKANASKAKIARGGRAHHGGWTCEGSGENPF